MELDQHGWTRLKKNNFIVNKPEEDKNQTLASRMDENKCKREREDKSFSKSLISKLERLHRKFKFQEKE